MKIVFIGLVSFFLCSCQDHNCIVEAFVNVNDSMIRKKTFDACNDSKIIEEQEFSVDILGRKKADGYRISYNNDGKVTRKNYFSEGYLYGSQFYYQGQGGGETEVDYYSREREKWLTLRFDENGNIVYLHGKLLHVILNEKCPYFDSIPIAIPLRLIEEVATLEKVKTILSVKISNGDVIYLDTTVAKFHPVLNSYMTGTQYKFVQKGSYDFVGTVTLVDSITGKVLLVDSLKNKMIVY